MAFSQKLKPLDRPVFHLILIALLGLIAYSNTFTAPFQWDDKNYIAENPIIKDLTYFLEPAKAEGMTYYGAFKNRYIGYLTFALNYKLHGLDVRGYHAVNIAIHILNAFLVYFLVILTFRTPFLRGSTLKEKSSYIALFSASLFVSHPVQTEAVTYIFQRLASLAAFFYMLSLVFYIKWRIYEPQRHGDTEKEGKNLLSSLCLRASVVKFSFYMLSLVSAVLAMKTKENAFTLPIMIALYEFFFFEGKIKKRLLWLTPLFLTMLIIPLSFLVSESGAFITDSFPKRYELLPREDYLFTQFRVITTYLRLLLLPANQNINYVYPIYDSFLSPQVLAAFVFLLSILFCAVVLCRRSKANRTLRFISLGIFWFFIALAVESSIVPLPLVINEYRVYLPSVGAFTAIAGSIFLLRQSLMRHRTLIGLLVFAVFLWPLLLSYVTYNRNAVWQSPIALWKDVADKSPNAPDSQNNLGIAYMEAGLYDDAIRHFNIALRLKEDNGGINYNLASAYQKKGSVDEAIKHYRITIGLIPNHADAHYNLGLLYLDKGALEAAEEEFSLVLRINPAYAQARWFLDYISDRKAK